MDNFPYNLRFLARERGLEEVQSNILHRSFKLISRVSVDMHIICKLRFVGFLRRLTLCACKSVIRMSLIQGAGERVNFVRRNDACCSMHAPSNQLVKNANLFIRIIYSMHNTEW